MNNRVVNFLLLPLKNLLLILLVGVVGSMLIHNNSDEALFFMSAEAAPAGSLNHPRLIDVDMKVNPANPTYISAVELRIEATRSLPIVEIQMNGPEGPVFRCSETITPGSWICLTPGLRGADTQQVQLKVTRSG